MTDVENCHQEHDELKGGLRHVDEQITLLADWQIRHTSEMHRTLVERSEIEAADRKGHDETEAIAAALLGERLPEIMGGGRNPEGSLSEKIEANSQMIGSLYSDSKNGGLKTRLSKGVVAILVALIGAVGVIGQSVIAHRHDTTELGQELDQKFDELRNEIVNELTP